MRDYAKVSPALWSRGSGRRLRGDTEAQLVAVYLLTCGASNMLGLYYLSIPAVAHDLGMGAERVAAAFAACDVAGFAHYDPTAELVWVVNVARVEFGDGAELGAKRRAGVEKELRKLGSHPFVDRWLEKYSDTYLLSAPRGGAKRRIGYPATEEGVSDSTGYPLDQKQKQKQKQEQEQEQSAPPVTEPKKPTQPGGAEAEYAEAYAVGQRAAGKAPFPAPNKRWDHGAIARFTQTPDWGAGLCGSELRNAIVQWSLDFRRAENDRPGRNKNFSPEACEEWARGSGWRYRPAKPPRMPQDASGPKLVPADVLSIKEAQRAAQGAMLAIGRGGST